MRGLIGQAVGLRQGSVTGLDILRVFTRIVGGGKPKDQVNRKPGVSAKHKIVRRISCGVVLCTVIGVGHGITHVHASGAFGGA